MELLVLGGGHQGKTVAEDLRAALPGAKIDVADIRPGAGTIQADLSDQAALERLISGCDLAVGVLPSKFGYRTMKAAIAARKSLVDLSFCPEDALSLDAEARKAGITILPDCGLAPGLSNLVVGRALARGPADAIRIEVGGIAEDPSRPYGYVVTWALEDLVEEYTRPARIRRAGKETELPVFSEMETIDFPGVGKIESFLTDGLRTLLRLDVRDMEEKTLRWPGHVEAIRPLLAKGALVETLRRECTAVPPRDLVAFRVAVQRGKKREETVMVDRFDGRLTAMARTTALTCSAIAQFVAGGGAVRKGVQPLEELGRDEGAYKAIMSIVGRHGVVLK